MASYYDSGTSASVDLQVWHQWTSSTTSATTANDAEIFRQWVTSDGTTSNVTVDTASSTDSTVWLQWVTDATGTITNALDEVGDQFRVAGRVIAEELTPHLEAIREDQRRERDAAEQRRREAKARARATLERFLDAAQRKQLQTQRFFEVVVGEAKRRYRVMQGRAGNVHLVDADGRKVASYCIHPRMGVPDEDTMLAQKLMLEHNEAEFLRVANEQRYQRAA